MKIYKCDRCAKEIAHHDRNKIDTREWDNTIDRFDLCTKCFNKVVEFMYGAKEAENE